MRCVLIGNYGVANLGDEALREYFLDRFPEIEWIVLSAHPHAHNELPRLPGGIRSLFRPGWGKTIKAMRQADAVVFGGGSLFTDVESVYACFLWYLHARTAMFFGKPVHLAFQGIGPYKTKIGEVIARTVVRRAASISVRDDASFKRVKNWSESIRVIQTFDPVFSVMVKGKIDENTKNVFTVIPRHNSGATLRQATDSAISQYGKPDLLKVLLMQLGDEAEQAWAHQVQESSTIPCEILGAETLDRLMKEIAGSARVVSQRFHGALAALAAGIPVDIVPQGAGDKLHELRQLIHDGKADIPALLKKVEEGDEHLSKSLNFA